MPARLASFNPRSKMGRLFLTYIHRRNKVWWTKASGDIDYSGDKTLRQYFFGNIWRELDRYSCEEIRSIRGRSLATQLRIILIGRHALRWPTANMLLNGATLAEMKAFQKSERFLKRPLVSKAIAFSQCKHPTYAHAVTAHRDNVDSNLRTFENYIRNGASAENLLKTLIAYLPGIGQFRAYEFITSLTYSEHTPYTENDVSVVGSGAIDGLRMLTGQHIAGGLAASAVLVRLRGEVAENLYARPNGWEWIPPCLQGQPTGKRDRYKFTTRTMEDCLCEFRKYFNYTTGGPNVRRRIYRPHVDTL